jgi:lipid-A-disaccharide synthase-like uncharacterized protein
MTEDGAKFAWELVGYAGQVLFGLSLVFQWWVSEKQKRSVIPVGFWWIRVGAASLVLAYALGIWKHQGPNITGQLLGLFTYSRNLLLIRRERRRSSEPASTMQP